MLFMQKSAWIMEIRRIQSDKKVMLIIHIILVFSNSFAMLM